MNSSGRRTFVWADPQQFVIGDAFAIRLSFGRSAVYATDARRVVATLPRQTVAAIVPMWGG